MTFQVTPFIMLDGNAKEAIPFYEGALNAKVVFAQTFGEAPPDPDHPVPDEAKNRIAHSVLQIGDATLFVADAEPGSPNRSGERVQICITAPDTGTSERLFDVLKQDGEVLMPLQQVHFSPAYGMVMDKYGVVFQIFTQRSQ